MAHFFVKHIENRFLSFVEALPVQNIVVGYPWMFNLDDGTSKNLVGVSSFNGKNLKKVSFFLHIFMKIESFLRTIAPLLSR